MYILNWISIIFVSVTCLVYWYFKVSFSYWKSRNVPHIAPTFPHGNIKGFGTEIHLIGGIKRIYDQLKGSGKFCGVYYYTSPHVVVLDLELAKTILNKDFHNFDDRGMYHNEKDDPLTANLFLLGGPKWKSLRQKLSPSFTPQRMKYVFPFIVEVSDIFRDCLQKAVKESDELDIRDWVARFMIDVTLTWAFGSECRSLKDPNTELRHMTRVLFDKPRPHIILELIVSRFEEQAKMLGIKAIPTEISSFFMNVIRDTVDYREKNNVNRNDFMDFLLKLKKQDEQDGATDKLTFKEIAAAAGAFFFAGFEPSARVLTLSLYELALNQEIQAKARDEIRNAFNRHGGKFSNEALADMPYIDQVLFETLRVHLAGNLLRKAKNDYRVPGTDHVIEKGIICLIPVYAIQHDAEYFPNPGKYDPDRFAHEEVQKRDTKTFLPFGDGPKNCIGRRFGLMQARVGLVALLSAFEFFPCAKTEIPLVITKDTFTRTPKNGVYLKLKPIKML